MSHVLILDEITSEPQLITQDKLNAIIKICQDGSDLSSEFVGQQFPTGEEQLNLTEGVSSAEFTNYGMRMNGAGVVFIEGMLVHRFAYLNAASGLTSYASIQARLNAAAQDAAVSEVLMVLHTPGGQVHGVFETADVINDIKKEKPVIAIGYGLTASAGYLLASAASKFYVTRSTMAGSIGVAMAHIDESKKMEAEGKVVTYIYAGEGKRDGNPHEPLPEPVRRRMQERVNSLYGDFTSHVAESRGMDDKDVRALGAHVYRGYEAVDLGLADGVTSVAEYLKNRGVTGPTVTVTTGEQTMSNGTPAEVPAVEQPTQAATVDVAAIQAEAAAATKQRISDILASDEAKSRPTLANHLAMNTDIDLETVKATLSASPVEDDKVDAAMSGLQNPDLGQETLDTEGEDAPSEPKANTIDSDEYLQLRRDAINAQL